MSDIQKFYSQIQFPGTYTINGLAYHDQQIKNPYIKIINSALGDNLSVLDVGCGTGLLTNLFARKYPSSNFTGVDFSESIEFAKTFAKDHKLTNTKFVKKDFLQYTSPTQYDVVVCQGVAHHIPDFKLAFERLADLVKPQGTLVLGLYHPNGKILKSYFNIDYRNHILYLDQEQNPFETSFTKSEVMSYFNTFKLVNAYPSKINIFMQIHALFNYRNGGLTTYILKKS